MKLKKFEAALLCALIFASAVGISGYAGTYEGIRSNVLRLHVLANSDSKEDQALKLKVRDRVLKEGKDIFDGAKNIEQAEKILKPQLGRLQKAAQDEVYKQGYKYPVKITISKEYFETRVYNNKETLPAGNYNAVRVIIGEGKGKNWWCIMFPPMCIPAAEPSADLNSVLTDGQIKIVEGGSKYEAKFKAVEIYENLKHEIEKASQK